MKLRSLSLAASLAAAALVSQSCSHKSGAADDRRVGLSVAFDAQAIDPVLAAQMKSLLIRVFKVENGAVAPSAEVTQTIAIVPNQTAYEITGVTLGLKEINVAILNAAGESIGTGKIQHLVVPGKNTTGAVTVTLSAVPDAKVSVTLDIGLTADAPYDASTLVKKVTIEWKTQSDGATASLELSRSDAAVAAGVSYTEMKPIIDENCASCHKSATNAAFGKLKLDVFPFKSGHNLDNNAILAKVMERIQNAGNPMPPAQGDNPPEGLTLPAPTVEKFKAWQAAGFPATSAAVAADGRYHGAIPSLKVSDMLSCTMTVLGEGGMLLDKETLADYIVAANTPLKADYKIKIQDPSISVPIVIVPAPTPQH